MKRNQWIRLAVFLISFAIFLMLPLHQYWMLKYTEGYSAVFLAKPVPCDKVDCIDFECVESLAPAAPGATDLGEGFVYFDLSGETARIAGVARNRREIPEKHPFYLMRDLKLTQDGKNYIVPLKFHYFAENPAVAANLRMQMVAKTQIKLAVKIFPNGEILTEKLIWE